MKKSVTSILELCSVEFTFVHFIRRLCSSLVSSGWQVSASFQPNVDSNISTDLHNERITFYRSLFYRSVKPRDLFNTWLSLKRLFSIDNSRVVHVHTPLLSYLVRLFFLVPFCRHNRKLIYTVHGFYFHSNGRLHSNLLHLLIELILLPACDLVFFVSRSDFGFASPYLKLLNIRHAYIGNGVCIDTFSPALPGHLHESSDSICSSKLIDSFVVGYVGRLVPEKGLLDLFSAFRSFYSLYPDSILLLVGARLDSDYDSSISHSLNSLLQACPDSVVCTGMIDDTNTLVHLYRSMNIFCLPSYREGLPTSLIEAMSCGIPSVATSIRGSSQLITHNKTGLLVPPKSPSELFSALCQLRSQPALMARISSNSRSLVMSDYNIHDSIDIQSSEISRL